MALRTPTENADDIKMKYACALTQLASPEDKIKVPSVGDRPPRELSRQALAEVVEPRYAELFTLVQTELERSGYHNLLAAGVVLTGGTSKMEGVVDLAEEIFHAPVRIGAPHNVQGLADIVKNPIYSTGVGLLLYGLKQHQERAGLGIRKEPQIQLVERVKGWFQGNF
jgi:cell division protein FtsA